MKNAQFSSSALLKELKSVSHDYKVSAVAGEITDNGVPADILYFKNLSLFKRFVSREIENIRWEEKEDQPGYLIFELNKEGLYDMLPEAIFHTAKKKDINETDSEKFKEQKREEKNARTFFSPLENEFARRLFYFDTIERELYKSYNPAKYREFFEYFFGSSNILSDTQVLTLMYILPLSHKIRSDVNLISQTMTRILNYQTVVTRKFKKAILPAGTSPGTLLGQGILGVNSIVSDRCYQYSHTYEITIHDIPVAVQKDFIKKGKHRNVIDFILTYFFPVNADVIINLRPLAAEKYFKNSDSKDTCFLSFNSYI